MRLALLGPSAPLRGGIAEYHDRLAAALAARGHLVRRLSYRRLYPQLLFPGRSQYQPEAERVPPFRASLASGRAAPEAEVAPGDAAGDRLSPPEVVLDSLDPRTWWQTAARAGDADAVVCEWWHPFFAPALASVAALLARRGVPTVLFCHNLEPHEWMPGARLLTALALGRAAGFVAHMPGDVARLRARYPGRPVALVRHPATPPAPCPHGAEREACARALTLPPAEHRLLFFGYVRRYKGLPTLIEALARLPGEVQLVVAGEIYDRGGGFYRELAASLGVAGRLVLLDRFVPAREVTCLFAAADVVVLPYWDATQSGVAPLAMACGRAVVTSAVGGLPELVREGVTGHLVPPRDPAALAAAITRALASAESLGAAARAEAGRLSWDAAAAVVEGVVADVLGKRAGPERKKSCEFL